MTGFVGISGIILMMANLFQPETKRSDTMAGVKLSCQKKQNGIDAA